MYNSGDYTKAVQYADRAIAIHDTYSAAYLTKGIALLNLEEKTAAKEAFAKAMQLDPDNARISELLEKCE